jgi:hypothetical protein
MIDQDYAIGYLRFDREYLNARGEVRTWKGESLGTARITSIWRVYSYRGSRMMQVECRIRGKRYTGRSFGNGLIWRGKRCKKQ